MAKGTRAQKTELHWTEELTQIDGVHIHDNHHLYMHTPLRVGGPVETWVRCSSVSGLRAAMPIVRKQSWRLHWPFEDWLVKDGGLNGIVLRLEGELEQIKTIEHGVNWVLLPSGLIWSAWKMPRKNCNNGLVLLVHHSCLRMQPNCLQDLK